MPVLMLLSSMANRFYVYELFDPRDGRVFYVGKGCGKRDTSHVYRARRGDFSNPAKSTTINEIEALGLSVGVRRVSEGLSERDAFRLERQQIAKYGIANLTNITPGSETEADRAESMAKHGLDLMGKHLSAMFGGASYSELDRKRVFALIREFREAIRATQRTA